MTTFRNDGIRLIAVKCVISFSKSPIYRPKKFLPYSGSVEACWLPCNVSVQPYWQLRIAWVPIFYTHLSITLNMFIYFYNNLRLQLFLCHCLLKNMSEKKWIYKRHKLNAGVRPRCGSWRQARLGSGQQVNLANI